MFLPKRALTNVELEHAVKELGISNFKGIFMRDELVRFKKPWKKECAIINQDISTNKGTHWCCYKKNGKAVKYYDPIGNLRPPRELLEYLKGCVICYNRQSDQKLGTHNCGHLNLKFLANPLTWPQHLC